jgi:hypothetical protein
MEGASAGPSPILFARCTFQDPDGLSCEVIQDCRIKWSAGFLALEGAQQGTTDATSTMGPKGIGGYAL